MCPSPGNLPNRGIEPPFPVSPAMENGLPLNHQHSPSKEVWIIITNAIFFLIFLFCIGV